MADVMITNPKTLPVEATVGAACAAFEDDHVHMLLLVDNGILRGTLVRADLAGSLSFTADVAAAVLSLSTLKDRTILREELVAVASRRLAESGQRRLAVVGAGNTLCGLLCLKRDRAGFCSDHGVAARALERQSPEIR